MTVQYKDFVMAEYKDLLQGKTLGHYVISHYVIKDFKF